MFNLGIFIMISASEQKMKSGT